MMCISLPFIVFKHDLKKNCQIMMKKNMHNCYISLSDQCFVPAVEFGWVWPRSSSPVLGLFGWASGFVGDSPGIR